ncbi:MAG: outer membrane protein assembly factor BamC [Neisseriaceae bacterium]|nr:MAG: outer membrane protein assembly factor BamC [Neisseriaceae bacterium]
MSLKNCSVKPIVFLTSMTLLSACGSTNRNQLDFETPGVKSASDRLVIPPDITGISVEDKYQLPNGAIRASEYNKKNQLSKSGQVLPRVEGVHIERSGNQRWLVIENKTPTELWSTLYSFWQNMGFVISKEEKSTGFMETQWAENRADIPSDPIRDFLTNIGLGSVYSSSVRDKFIIRVETDGIGGSIVTFTNQKREEVFTGHDRTTTKWVSKPSDTNLEAQFLARYMLSLGYDKNTVAKELDKVKENLLASLNQDSLTLKGDHNRNKYRLKLALDRIGLNILDYSNNTNTIVVSPAPDQSMDKQENGFLNKIFGRNKQKAKVGKTSEKIYVTITPQGNQDLVRVYDNQKRPHAKQDVILNRLYLELR